MKLLKKTAAVVTAASLLAVGNIGIMPRDAVKNFMLSVSAADSDIVASGKFGIYGDNLTWELDSKGTLTISGQGEMNNSSSVPWYSYRYNIVSVVIEDGVTSIGYYAFRGCHSLTSITIPDSVTSIGDSAFADCVGLTSITIPDSVTSIGYGVFDYCDRLTAIYVDLKNKYYASEDGVLFNKDKSVLVLYPKGKTAEKYVIPAGVTSIGAYAFNSCKRLTSIIIPDSVTSIGDWAFYFCDNLTSITIPDSVTSIGDSAFEYCGSLTSIILTDGVTSIGDWAFYWCDSLTSITIPDSITTIGVYAFAECESLTSITIPDGVTSIGDSAFVDCVGLTSIEIRDGVTSIGDYAFYHCKNLTSITIPDSVTSIGDWAFYNCDSLTSITIKNPECRIDSSLYFLSDTVTIYGHEGSTAQSYANRYGIRFELIAPLSIVKQPESVVVPNGKKASVTVNATGDGLTYKWYYKNKSMTKFVESTSMTSATYSVDKMTSARDGRQLYCVITDKYGNSVKTDTVTLSIGNALKITAQPESVVVPNGKKASVTVNATGDVLTYTWYVCSPTGTKYTKSSITSATYSYAMTSEKSGRKVYCVITDKYGNSVKTDTVTLSIGNALKITAQPESVVVPNGKKASVTVNATGDGLTYTWYVCSPTGTKYTKSSITSATYSYAMTSEKSGRKVYCVITDKYGNSVKTDTVTLSIGNALKITAQPESVVVPNGKKASVTVNATGEGLTYKWYYKNKGASKFSYTSTFNGNKYSVTMSDSRDGRQIYCVITDKYGNSVKTETVTLIQE